MAAERWQLDQSITRSQAFKINQITKQSNSQIIYKGATGTRSGEIQRAMRKKEITVPGGPI